MKNLCVLLFCSCLLGAVPLANAAPSIAGKTGDFSTAKPAPITRDAKDPLVLNLMGRTYAMFTSREDEDNSDIWQNGYLPKGVNASLANPRDAILITKNEETSCEEEMKDVDLDEILSMDTRLRDDKIISAEITKDGKTDYTVIRCLQAGADAFALQVIFPRTTQSDEQWQQIQRHIFSSVQKTPTNVILDNFVEAVCKFGSDCRAQ